MRKYIFSPRRHNLMFPTEYGMERPGSRNYPGAESRGQTRAGFRQKINRRSRMRLSLPGPLPGDRQPPLSAFISRAVWLWNVTLLLWNCPDGSFIIIFPFPQHGHFPRQFPADLREQRFSAENQRCSVNRWGGTAGFWGLFTPLIEPADRSWQSRQLLTMKRRCNSSEGFGSDAGRFVERLSSLPFPEFGRKPAWALLGRR